MRIALDPYMYRNLSLGKMVDKVAELGYEHIELSPRVLERVKSELCR